MVKKHKLVYHSARIGIDISDYSIEVLALSKKGSVLGYGRTILSPGIVVGGEVIKADELAAILAKTLKSATPQSIFEISKSIKKIFPIR